MAGSGSAFGSGFAQGISQSLPTLVSLYFQKQRLELDKQQQADLKELKEQQAAIQKIQLVTTLAKAPAGTRKALSPIVSKTLGLEPGSAEEKSVLAMFNSDDEETKSNFLALTSSIGASSDPKAALAALNMAGGDPEVGLSILQKINESNSKVDKNRAQIKKLEIESDLAPKIAAANIAQSQAAAGASAASAANSRASAAKTAEETKLIPEIHQLKQLETVAKLQDLASKQARRDASIAKDNQARIPRNPIEAIALIDAVNAGIKTNSVYDSISEEERKKSREIFIKAVSKGSGTILFNVPGNFSTDETTDNKFNELPDIQ